MHCIVKRNTKVSVSSSSIILFVICSCLCILVYMQYDHITLCMSLSIILPLVDWSHAIVCHLLVKHTCQSSITAQSSTNCATLNIDL